MKLNLIQLQRWWEEGMKNFCTKNKISPLNCDNEQLKIPKKKKTARDIKAYKQNLNVRGTIIKKWYSVDTKRMERPHEERTMEILFHRAHWWKKRRWKWGSTGNHASPVPHDLIIPVLERARKSARSRSFLYPSIWKWRKRSLPNKRAFSTRY